MSTSLLIFIELLLVFGIVFGLCGRELWLLRRDRRRQAEDEDERGDR